MVQLVECLLAKEKVVGSSPIARSDKPLKRGFYFGLWEAVHSHRPLRQTPEKGFLFWALGGCAFLSPIQTYLL